MNTELVEKIQNKITNTMVEDYKNGKKLDKALYSNFKKSSIKTMFAYCRFECLYKSMEKITEIEQTNKHNKIKKSFGIIFFYLDKALEEIEKLTHIITK